MTLGVGVDSVPVAVGEAGSLVGPPVVAVVGFDAPTASPERGTVSVVPWDVTAVRVTLNRPGSSAVCESVTWQFSPGCSSTFSQPFPVIDVSPVSVAAAKSCNVVG
ncbi:hypothetical protein ACFWAN_49910 [Streptomyces mirabilis]|uniref:hypothetical protein n=1 Tax=Streptomyces mirabilis TaxID=68239 RepID=UPI00364F748F